MTPAADVRSERGRGPLCEAFPDTPAARPGLVCYPSSVSSAFTECNLTKADIIVFPVDTSRPSVRIY